MTIKADERGKCPHCVVVNRFENVRLPRGNYASLIQIQDGESNYNDLEVCKCSNCGEIIVSFNNQMIYPLGSQRPNAPKEVPENIREDFNEACLVEPLSKKASAALARRCLQNMLHNQEIKKSNLSQEIDEAIKKLPSYLSGTIDAIRNFGNFAAHPTKSTNTGEVIEVEAGETEWLLDVLEQLFDFYYVQPAITKAKKQALDAKLKSAGKPPSK